MVGFRKLETFIEKYGEEQGRIRYEKVLEERKKRNLRKTSGRTIVMDNSAEALKIGDAIQCCECNQILTRLQWTHFKTKCSGHIKTISDYRIAYPDAPLVAPNLIKSMPVSLVHLEELYGREEGRSRWEAYRNKQAYSNTLEAKAEKYGWSKNQFDEYNQSRSSTLSHFIKRHGEENGITLWNEYIERQRYTTQKEYFIEKYGEDLGLQKFNDFCYGRNMTSKNQSKVELEVWIELSNFLIDLDSQVSLNHPYIAPFDMGNLERKKLIEFYGTYWHCDPRFFHESFYHPQKQMSSKAIRSRDQAKRTYATSQGYQILVIWEHDWKYEKESVLNQVKKWWNDD